MNILDLIDTKVSSYTKTDRAIYEKLKKYPGKFVSSSYNEIVKDIDVSPAALTRFAKKPGFNEFQFQLSSDLQNRKNENSGGGMAEKYAKALARTEESVTDEQLTATAGKIINARKVFCLGFPDKGRRGEEHASGRL